MRFLRPIRPTVVSFGSLLKLPDRRESAMLGWDLGSNARMGPGVVSRHSIALKNSRMTYRASRHESSAHPSQREKMRHIEPVNVIFTPHFSKKHFSKYFEHFLVPSIKAQIDRRQFHFRKRGFFSRIECRDTTPGLRSPKLPMQDKHDDGRNEKRKRNPLRLHDSLCAHDG